jgi:hypothetical protein
MMLCLASGTARAQAVRAAEPGDSLIIAQNTFDRLFEGIKLPSEQRAKALDVILATHRAQRALSPVSTRESWQRLAALQDQRDSTLKLLLTNAADSAKFEARAAEMRPRSNVWGT